MDWVCLDFYGVVFLCLSDQKIEQILRRTQRSCLARPHDDLGWPVGDARRRTSID
jgi:hypothetical protein